MEALALILLLLGLFFYFIPAYVGSVRNAEHGGSIFFINLLFGWTVLGWFAALIWACTDKQKPKAPPSRSNWSQPFYK